MTFFELQEKDVISIEYTAYPTRSYSLDLVAVGEYSQNVYLQESGSNAVGISRTYFDINGRPIEQSYYAKSKVYIKTETALTGTNTYMKKAISRLRNTYASSSFYRPYNFDSASVYSSNDQDCSIISIPNMSVGSGIKPGSFSISSGTVFIASDDGFGGLYSGSELRGCIFYEYGLGYLSGSPLNGLDECNMYFSAVHHMPMNVYICNAPKGMANFSTNPSYTELSGTKNYITMDKPKTFISTIVLYDEDFEPVGVAKVATPNLKEEIDGIQYRLKLNF